MASNRTTRRLEHQKAFRVRIGSGPPRNNEGSDGELALRSTKSGLKLFAKHRNKWYIVGEQSLGLLGGRDGDESLQVHNMASGTTINSRTGNLNMGGAIVFGKVNTGVAQKGEAQSKLYAAGSGNVNFDVAGDLTVDVKGGQFTIESSAAGALDPDLILIGQHNSAAGCPTLQFEAHRNGTDNSQDNDILGALDYFGYNDNGDRTQYGRLMCQALDVTDGDERGHFYWQVMTNSASGGGSGLITGLALAGSTTDDVVNANIGSGTTSTTTVAGNLDIDGTEITAAGNLTINPTGDLTINPGGNDASFLNLNTLTIAGVNDTADPKVSIYSTHNGSGGPILEFIHIPIDSSEAMNDKLGRLHFIGRDSDNNTTTYAEMEVLIGDVTSDTESGLLKMKVITENSSAPVLTTGFILAGSNTNDEVNAWIGAGTASVTTIAGDLDIDGDAITAPGNLTITPAGGQLTLSTTGSASRPNLVVETNDNGTEAGWLAFMHNSDSPAVNDTVGQIRFYGKNDASPNPESNEYGNIKVQIGDETDGTGAGKMYLGVLTKDSGGTGDGIQTGFSLQGTDTNDIVDCSIATGAKLNFDTFGDTYIVETNADELSFFVGGVCMFRFNENGSDGQLSLFRAGAVGFTRKEATFSATTVIGSGGTDDTDIDFRFSNKYRLEMTGDIINMNLIFPNASGNFTLVCTTNGDHDVSNWKVYESDESAATTTDVMWAGGSVPAFTNNGIDIVTFYWDSTEEQCYGVASLAFATP